MESHLANHCTKAPVSVVREYLQKLSGEDSETAKKKRKTISQHLIKDFYDPIKELPKGHISQINRVLAKLLYVLDYHFKLLKIHFSWTFSKS